MPPAKAKRHPQAELAAGCHRLDPGGPQARGEAERRRSRPGARAAAEQRRVRPHDPRPDRRRHPADAGVPRRSRQRGRVRQLGGIAGDVAGPGQEVPGGRAAGRRPCRPRSREGFAFAPHPVVADTDRDKYCVRQIIDFYKRQRTDYADYFLAAWRFQHRAGARPAGGVAGRHRRRGRDQPQVPGDGLVDS